MEHTDPLPKQPLSIPPINSIFYCIFFICYTVLVSIGSLWAYTSYYSTPQASPQKYDISPSPYLQEQALSDEQTTIRQSFTTDILEKNPSLKTQFTTAKVGKISKAEKDGGNPFYALEVTATNSADTNIYVVTKDYGTRIDAIPPMSALLGVQVFYNRAVITITSGQNMSTFILLNRDNGAILKFSDPHKLIATTSQFSDIKKQLDSTGFFEGEFIDNSILFGNKLYLFQQCGYCAGVNGNNIYTTFSINAQTGEILTIEPFTVKNKE